MEAMIKNDDEKTWMTPLLDLRNDLADFSQEKVRRDFRRMNGRVQLFYDSVIRGPYNVSGRPEPASRRRFKTSHYES